MNISKIVKKTYDKFNNGVRLINVIQRIYKNAPCNKHMDIPKITQKAYKRFNSGEPLINVIQWIARNTPCCKYDENEPRIQAIALISREVLIKHWLSRHDAEKKLNNEINSLGTLAYLFSKRDGFISAKNEIQNKINTINMPCALACNYEYHVMLHAICFAQERIDDIRKQEISICKKINMLIAPPEVTPVGYYYYAGYNKIIYPIIPKINGILTGEHGALIIDQNYKNRFNQDEIKRDIIDEIEKLSGEEVLSLAAMLNPYKLFVVKPRCFAQID